ncbi:outer membrane protein [Bradyrhizobium sp. sBnM-33]|uniref:outer membrane protein n=1 Tax=Bradyrhizobium sp. sBnM-33 TaxID=2831780 RepID=UPI001BCD2FEC|nr:outer membrane beta-barrel protein [Bradyrhizobium sp. sBnM-33]WOH49689.1 outer membrane beta-barrel protein [Bradyrhizobium sp. sBnM-33]
MRSVKSFIAAGAATLLSQAAFAADMAIAPPPYAAAPVVEDFGGWYLRGDIGFSNQRVDRLNNALDATTTSSVQTNSFGTAGIFGLGVGYKVNNWFRADVTGEYRGNSQFFGKDVITFPGGFGTDTYHATKSEWVVLGNAYVDLGTWWCVTPFIGAGVGGARVSIANFTDQGITNFAGVTSPSLAFGDNVAKWNFAWAAHAGLAYKVTPNFTVELAYRYLDMGDGLTGDLRTFDGTNNINNPTTFKNITSHDLKLGVRWDLTSPQVYAPPPLIRKG